MKRSTSNCGQIVQYTSRSSLLVLILFFLGTVVKPGYSQTVQAAGDHTLHPDDSHLISYSGSYRDFTIPAWAEGKYLYLKAQGGDGGTIDFNKDIHPGKGGQGASVFGYFRIGSGTTEIPVGATLRVIVGQAGGSHTNTGQTFNHSGGGGGGTGILFLPPGVDPENAEAAQWKLLSVAGGGGGAYAKWGGKIRDGLPGNDGKNGTGDNSDYQWDTKGIYMTECINNMPKYEGWGGTSGGGTGYILRNTVCDQVKDNDNHPIGDADVDGDGKGYGGFQRKNGKMQPIGHTGGKGNQNPDGGFGFGSGGGGIYIAPGGGGGYEGGAQGSFGPGDKAAGGGGSYVNAKYALPGTAVKVKNGTTRISKNGYVQYQFFGRPVADSLAKDQQYTYANSRRLLNFGDYTLRWQKDGNLVLYKGDFIPANAQWSTNTNGRGTSLSFQKDGNLVIRDASNTAIWASATADDQQNGKGGVSLTLTPFGALSILNSDGENIWSFY